MKNIRQLLCILVMTLLTSAAAFAEIDTVYLTAGTWLYENSSLEFQADGSGTFVNKSGKSFAMNWSQSDGQICVEYQFYGNRKLTLTAIETDGKWTLTSEDGENYSIGGTAAQKEDNAYPLEFGEEIDLGFAKITFSRVQLMREMHASGNGTYVTAPKDSRYFALVGTITNRSTGSLEVGNLLGEISLDGYIYAASTKADHNNQLTTSVTPMTTSNYYVFAAIPDTLTKTAASGQIKLAFNDNFQEKPSDFDHADFVFKFTFDNETIAQAWLPPEKEMVYFSECPALPMPSSYSEVEEVSNFVMVSDDIKYTYKKQLVYDDKEDLFEVYHEGLRKSGYALKDAGESFQVYVGTTKIAEVKSASFGWIDVTISKGLSAFSKRPTPGTTASVPEASNSVLKLGTTITPANVKLTLADTGIADILYSCIKPGNGRYYYYEPEDGERFFYLHGVFNNVGGKPLDIRHIYAEIIFDDKYHYEASSVGVKVNATDFINTVSAQSSCDYYVFASVPTSVLNKYKTCTIKLGFTDDFGFQYVKNDLPDFTHCDTVYELKVR